VVDAADLDAFAAEHGFTKVDPIPLHRIGYSGQRGRDARPWTVVTFQAPRDRIVLGDDPGEFKVSVLLDAHCRFIMAIGTHPGWTDQRHYSLSGARRMIEHRGVHAIAKREAKAAAIAAERSAQRAEADRVEALIRDRFVGLVRRAAQAGAEIGRLRDTEVVTMSFDDLDLLLARIEEHP